MRKILVILIILTSFLTNVQAQEFKLVKSSTPVEASSSDKKSNGSDKAKKTNGSSANGQATQNGANGQFVRVGALDPAANNVVNGEGNGKQPISRELTPFDMVHITDINVEKTNDEVWVFFNADVDDDIVKSGVTMVYSPIITNGQYDVSLPAMVIQDWQARIIKERYDWAGENSFEAGNEKRTKPGKSISYTGVVPYQTWMDQESYVDVEVATSGRNKYSFDRYTLMPDLLVVDLDKAGAEIAPELLAREETTEPEGEAVIDPETGEPRISYVEEYVAPEIVEEQWIQPEPQSWEPTVAEMISETLTFIEPIENLPQEATVRYFDEHRDNSLTIYFDINSAVIDPNYSDNRQSLQNLKAAIDMIASDPRTQVNQVIVSGFASPDGRTEVNDKLAMQRAVAVQDYLLKNTILKKKNVKVHSGGADWNGLRQLVIQDNAVPHRQQVLDIIDNHPIWDPRKQVGRMTLIRRLGENGESYRYLADNVFPLLRNGAFIRVYFEVN